MLLGSLLKFLRPREPAHTYLDEAFKAAEEALTEQGDKKIAAEKLADQLVILRLLTPGYSYLAEPCLLTARLLAKLEPQRIHALAREVQILMPDIPFHVSLRNETANFMLDAAIVVSKPLTYDYEAAASFAHTAMTLSNDIGIKRTAKKFMDSSLRKTFIPAKRRDAIMHRADLEAAAFDGIGFGGANTFILDKNFTQESVEKKVTEHLEAQGKKPLPVPTKKQARAFTDRFKRLISA